MLHLLTNGYGSDHKYVASVSVGSSAEQKKVHEYDMTWWGQGWLSSTVAVPGSLPGAGMGLQVDDF